jgi:hypothetical protein
MPSSSVPCITMTGDEEGPSSAEPGQADRYAHIYRGRRGHGAGAHSRNGRVSRRAICFDYGFRSPPPMNNGCILQ